MTRVKESGQGKGTGTRVEKQIYGYRTSGQGKENFKTAASIIYLYLYFFYNVYTNMVKILNKTHTQLLRDQNKHNTKQKIIIFKDLKTNKIW